MINLILLGLPGAGKGTASEQIVDKYHIAHISTGDMFREAMANKTPVGLEAKSYIDKGDLVPDEVTAKLVEERLGQDDVKNGFILDGYPRHMPQVEAVNQMMDELNLKIDYAVLLKVDYDLALKRTLGRQICPNCKKSYNRLTGVNAPKVEDMCDDCNVPLTTRNDDNEETFKIGFAAYEKNCAPVIEYYRNKGMLIELDASKDPEYTFEQLEKIIGSKND